MHNVTTTFVYHPKSKAMTLAFKDFAHMRREIGREEVQGNISRDMALGMRTLLGWYEDALLTTLEREQNGTLEEGRQTNKR